jgi:hypothetical protein
MAGPADELTHWQDSQEREDETTDTRALQSQIAHTRSEMSRTIDQIQGMLSPAHLKAQAQETIREATVGRVEDMAYRAEMRARSWVETVKDNPIPAALVGIGLGWMLLSNGGNGKQRNGGSRRQYTEPHRRSGGEDMGRYASWQEQRYYQETPSMMDRTRDEIGQTAGRVGERIGETAENVGQRIGETAETVSHRIGETADHVGQRIGQTASQVGEQVSATAGQVQHKAQEVAGQARTQADRAGQSFGDAMRENPLAVGAMAVALGAAVGLALPSTRKEDELMGEARDRLVDEARDAARQTAQRVQHVAEEAKDTALEDMRRQTEGSGSTWTRNAGRSMSQGTSMGDMTLDDDTTLGDLSLDDESPRGDETSI